MSSISEIIVNIRNATEERAKLIVAAVAGEVKMEAIRRADRHTKTGRMINSIRMRKIENGYEVVAGGSVAPYTKYVHDGREAKVVTKSNLMHFFWNGKEIFTHRVKHPGYKGDNFMTDAANDVRSRISRIAGGIK